MKLTTIYFDHQFIGHAGFLLGTFDKNDKNIICISILPIELYLENQNIFENEIFNYKNQSFRRNNILGLLNCEDVFNESELHKFKILSNDKIDLLLLTVRANEKVKISSLADTNISSRSILIFFDSNEIWSSVLFDNEYNCSSDMSADNIQGYKIYSALKKSYETNSLSQFLKTTNNTPNFKEKKPSYCMQIIFYISNLLQILMNLLPNINTNRILSSCFPTVFLLLHSKCKNFTEMSNLAKNNQKSRLIQHRHKNLLCSIIFDVCLGIIFTLYITSFFDSASIAESLLSWTEWIAIQLVNLLDWLMGFPAGLKLNKALTKVLGRFFLYHIYLWKDYLRLLYPLWSRFLKACSFSGLFGFTFQLALLRDLLSIMTLHTYCFYVYAARLYYIFFYSLKSLVRLFIGRKWNILRNRVDSLHFDLDQLFVGTLLFSILLFLLPTVVLFYSVFCMMRLVVLAVQGFLNLTQKFISNLHVYFIVGQIAYPQMFSDQTQVSIYQGDPLCLKYELKPASIVSLYKIAHNKDLKINFDYKFLIIKILTGQLLYPWIEPVDTYKSI